MFIEQRISKSKSKKIHHVVRSMDLAMLEFHNAMERDGDDWARLLHKADGGFHMVDIKQPPGSSLSVIEVRWLLSEVQNNVTLAEGR